MLHNILRDLKTVLKLCFEYFPWLKLNVYENIEQKEVSMTDSQKVTIKNSFFAFKLKGLIISSKSILHT